ncbi:hypothetical protein ILUMI_05503 [Ignelater luminosus]|uniref:Uncharacterized protein n=1 Tax=Ignelater luminosus TaxID=2038154 RepID=A0A8K0D7L2_IGNLU|nr:hypothetical protein ILUMI_05503 [Ignelater luminosus]
MMLLRQKKTRNKRTGRVEMRNGHLMLYCGVKTEQRVQAGVVIIVHKGYTSESKIIDENEKREPKERFWEKLQQQSEVAWYTLNDNGKRTVDFCNLNSLVHKYTITSKNEKSEHQC